MIMSLSRQDLKDYLARQLDFFFPDHYKFKGNDIEIALTLALEKLEYCFEHINFRHYSQNGQAEFKHLYSDQYSQFLYVLSNVLWNQSQNKPICDKLVQLNKALNGFLCPYTVQLPDICLFLHPIGTVLGNAVFSDYLVIAQQVTVNFIEPAENQEPLTFGKGVFLSAGCKILGNKRVGDYASIGVNTIIHNMEVPDNSVVFTDADGAVKIKMRRKDCRSQFYFHNFLNE